MITMMPMKQKMVGKMIKLMNNLFTNYQQIVVKKIAFRSTFRFLSYFTPIRQKFK